MQVISPRGIPYDLYSMKNVTDILSQNVEDAMSTNVITLNPKESLSRAIEIFEAYDLHHIPIVILDRLVGIISQGDVLYLKGKEQNRDTIMTHNLGNSNVSLHSTVEEIMTTNPITIEKTASMNDAIQILLKNRINALPVTDEDALVGIITTHDILKFITSK